MHAEMSSAVASTSNSLQGGGRVGGNKDKSAAKRLQQELMQLMMSGDKAATAFPTENLFNWVGTIKGSNGTVYEGLEYKLSIQFPADYPYTAPTIKFTTPCFHPNVDNFGVRLPLFLLFLYFLLRFLFSLTRISRMTI